MKIILHQDAIKNFNEKAEDLLNKLITIPINSISKNERSFNPEHFISATLNEKDVVGDIIVSSNDLVGNEVARFFDYEGNRIGLSGEGYQSLLKISENIQRTKQIYPLISISFIKNNIFDWVKNKYLGRTSSLMVDYLLEKCEQELRDLEIWIPVAETFIQSELRIGKITLKAISKDVLEQWMGQWGNDTDKKEQMRKGFMDKYQKKLQGLSAATIKLYAEPQRAFEIAVEESRKTLSILRIYSPAIFYPRLNSYCVLLGEEHLEGYTYFQVNNGKLLSVTEGLTDKSGIAWAISDNLISEIRPRGLDILSKLLNEGPKTEFQEQVLDSIFLYSKSPLAKDIADKLIYILVAIESILLKDETEAIQQNISGRMALILRKTPKDRKEIIANVKEIYKLRSSFIHHGQHIEDVKTLEIFMKNIWVFFQILIQNIGKFNDKQELIEKIEEIGLSGSTNLLNDP